MTEDVNIVLVDDHQIILDGLSEMIRNEKGIHLMEVFKDPRKVLDYCLKNEVDILITDLEMGEMSGDQLLEDVKRSCPNTKVLVLTMHSEKSVIKHLLNSGADGYLLKSGGKELLLKAINEIMSGSKYFSNSIMDILVKEGNQATKSTYHPKLNDLTNREKEILALIAEGFSSKEIGNKLFISNRTAETHRSNIMKKLEIHNIAGLIKFAYQTELL